MKFIDIMNKAINDVREEHGLEKVELKPCKVVQICSNGRHKDVVTGKFCD